MSDKQEKIRETDSDELTVKVSQLWCKPEFSNLVMIPEFANSIVDLLKEEITKAERKKENLHESLIFVGYTNGYHINYATDREIGEGSFYYDTLGDCFIPLYMLKTHAHRIETTSDMNFSLEKLKEQRKGN